MKGHQRLFFDIHDAIAVLNMRKQELKPKGDRSRSNSTSRSSSSSKQSSAASDLSSDEVEELPNDTSTPEKAKSLREKNYQPYSEFPSLSFWERSSMQALFDYDPTLVLHLSHEN